MNKLITFASIILVLISVWFTLPFWSSREVTATVVDKARITVEDRGYYLIYTDEKVYKNKDCFVCWKFNSSNIYGELRKGETYQLKVYGFRFPIFSLYPNIWKVE